MARILMAITAVSVLVALAGHPASPARAGLALYVDNVGNCNGESNCYETIQQAVNDASPGSTVFVFPGTYAESVDLSLMGTAILDVPGAITIITVNSAGEPEPRTASVAPASGPAMHAAAFPASITINGLIVTSPDDTGIGIASLDAVTLRNVLASGNGGHGVEIVGGNIDVRESTVEENEGDGFRIGSYANIELQRLTAIDNGGSGITIMPPPALGEARIPAGGNQVLSFNVAHSMIMDNSDEGVLISGNRYAMDGNFRLRENVICGNGDGVRSAAELNIDAIATWWGAFSGPTHPNNPGGTGDTVLDSSGDDAGIIEYDPFIHHIDILVAFGDVVISFLAGTEGTPPRLNQGPGDPNGPPPFEIHAEPGTVTTSGMIVNGNLTGTLEGVDGEVDVSVTGPCGLSGPAGLLWGDLDCDGNLAIGDALKTARYLLGLSVSQQPGCPLPGADVNADGTDRIWGDIDCDGGIAIGDALKIARRLLGLTVSQAEGCPLLGTPVQVQ